MFERKRGRPCKDDSMDIRKTIRMTEEEASMLEYIRWETEKTESDVVRRALKLYYEMLKRPY